MVFDELRELNARTKTLRSRMSRLRDDIQVFMQDRGLEKLGTRDGRIAVRVMTTITQGRLGKKDTVRCVDETIGEDHPELAQKLLAKLYEDNKKVRTFTKFDKRDPVETI